MADVLKGLFGGDQVPNDQAAAPEDADFADFAAAPDPTPIQIVQDTATGAIADSIIPTSGILPLHQRPYTKWYRVWERVYLQDFYTEMFILPFILIVLSIHFWGTRKNKRKAQSWLAAHGPVLQQEFAVVGFSPRKVDLSGLDGGALSIPEELLKEKTASEYVSYASGRQNIAFVDFKLAMHKRYNPMNRFAEMVIGLIFESMPAPVEKLEATSYVFDGKEAETLALVGKKDLPEGKFHSSFDGFVWGIVHKDSMNNLRADRYDLSLTITKDNPKLPQWVTVMSESAEITDMLLTPELIKAINEVGEDFESLIISDQPIDRPRTLNETFAKKRITLNVRLPSTGSTTASSYAHQLPLFTYFIRLADILAANAHFRPEVARRMKATREEEAKKIKKVGEGEKAEERRLAAEREKKRERDEKLSKMSADEQRKYLERERASDMRRGMKKRTMRS